MRTAKIVNYYLDFYSFIVGVGFKEVVILIQPWAYCLTN
jgi:hypothetical protein